MTEKKAEVSYLNTFNPLSSFLGGGDKVPQWAYNIAPNDPDLSHLVFKTGACALLAAGIVGGIRGVQHLNRISDMADRDNPAGKLKSHLTTTFDMPLNTQNKEAAAYSHGTGDPGTGHYESTFTLGSALGLALPVGASLIAAGLAYKSFDSLASNRRNAILDKSIKAKGDAIKELMQVRARIAKGNITQEEVTKANNAVNNEDIYIKNASAWNISTNESALGSVSQKALQILGLMSATLLAVSAGGAYAYYSRSDENNIKFKALQKGLTEYAKNKAGLQPVTIVPSDSKGYFDKIDGDTKPATVRQEPEVDPDALNKPISVTL